MKITSRNNQSEVGASYFMTYHSVLKTSTDYIKALKFARELGDNITKALSNPDILNPKDGRNVALNFKNITAKVFPYRYAF